METIRLPFHHAVEYKSLNGTTTSRTVTSGDVKYGYDKANNYSNFTEYGSSAPRYYVYLYFEIPDDLYKYTSNRPIRYKFAAEVDTRTYKYYYTPQNPGNSHYENLDESYSTDDYKFYSVNNTEVYTGFNPSPSVSPPFLLKEENFVFIQISAPEDFRIYTVLGYGYTDNGKTYDDEYLQVFEKIGRLITLKDVENFYLDLDLDPVESIVNPVYPVDVYVRQDRDLIVSWNISNSANRNSGYIYVTSSEVTITDSENNSITASISGSDTTYTFDAEDVGTLSVGQCTVEVEVENNYGGTASASWVCDLIGETDAPEITSVTQNSYPTITWTSTSQIAWELQISDANGIVYKKSMTPGTETSFTVPKLLNDGEYSIELRYMNTYGIISDWGSYYLDLEPTKPSAPEGIIVSARADFGISISCNDMVTTGKLLAVRRKNSDSEAEVLGEYNGSFIDYLVGLNDPHEYTVRNYVEGYADGEWIDGTLAYSGVIIRDADDYSKYAHVWMSEDKTLNYINNDERSDVLTQCVGRKYAVLDIGEWLTTERSFVGYVSNEEFKKLQKIKIESTHVLMQSQEEYFPCYMSMSDQGEYNDGRIVSFVMTRIDGEK